MARKYGIVTPYTSYLILEDEEAREVPVARRSLGGVAPGAPVPLVAEDRAALTARAKESYDSFKSEKSGEEAVRGAAAGSVLKNAKGLSDYSAARKITADKKGDARRRLTSENRIVSGKTFHRVGNMWIDDDARDDSDKKIEELKFGTKAYFDFLENHPEMIQWLSLGTEVDVFHQGRILRCRR